MYIMFLWSNKTKGQRRPHTASTEMTLSWFNRLLSSYQTADFLLGFDKDVTMLHSLATMKVGFRPGVLLVFRYSSKRLLEVLRRKMTHFIDVVEMYCEIL